MSDTELNVKLSLIDNLSNQLKQVNDNVKSSSDQMQSNFGSLAGAMQTVGVTMTAVGAAIVTSLTLSIKSFIDLGVEVNALADETGLSTTNLQNWQGMMNATGANAGSLTMILKTMATSITDMSGNSGNAQKAIASLGLNLQQLQSESPDEQFNTLTTAIANVQNPTERLNDATNIFGRSGLQLLPILSLGADGMKQLSDFEQKNVDMSNDEVIAAADLKIKLTELTGSFHGVWNEIANSLEPVIKPLITDITNIIVNVENWVKSHEDLTRTLTEVALALGTALIVIGGIVAAVKTATIVWEAFNAVFIASPVGLIVLALTALVAIAVLIIMNWQSVEDFFIQFWNVLKAGFADVVKFISDSCIKPLTEGIAILLDGIANAVSVFSGSWAASIRSAADDVKGLSSQIDNWTDSIKNNAEADYAAQQQKEIAQKAAKDAKKDNTDTDTAALVDNSAAAIVNKNAVDDSSMSLFQDTQDENDNADAVESDSEAFQKAAKAMVAYNSVLAGVIQMMVNGPGTTGESLADALVTFGNAINEATGSNATTIISSLNGNINITPTDDSAQAKANANDYGNDAGHGTGGVFNKEHVARVAEKGNPEAIVPLNSDMTPDVNGLSVLSRLNLASIKMPSLNTDSFRPVTGLASAGGATSKSPDSMTLNSQHNITLTLDGSILAKFINKQTGLAFQQRQNI